MTPQPLNKPNCMIVCCGSFNPPTFMHLRLFELARDHLTNKSNYNVEGGIMSPCNSAYKKNGLLSGEHRVAMCKLSVESSNWITVDSCEALDSTQFQPTLLVLKQLQQRHKNCKLMLLCGGDLFEKMCKEDSWNCGDVLAIIEQFGLVVVPREGVNCSLLSNDYPFVRKVIGKVIFVDNPIENIISSTLVRDFIKNRFSVKYLVPDKVIDYIHKNQLYA